MGLFGSRTATPETIDPRLHDRLVQTNDRRYNNDLQKAALKEGETVLGRLALGEEVLSASLGEGMGAAGVVQWGSLVVITDHRLLVSRGRKIRNELVREDINHVETGHSLRGRLRLTMQGSRSDGSYETTIFEFDDAPRMDAFMRTLGYSMY